jgi:UDPglucose 6-dehydrogenase
VADKRIAVLGFAFKKDTNDTRESPAIAVCRDRLAEQANVAVYDPRVPAEVIESEILGGVQPAASPTKPGRLIVARSAYEAVAGAHALAVLTEWDEFKALDFAKIHGLMTKPAVVFDGRNILDLARLRTLGFRTCGIGQPA